MIACMNFKFAEKVKETEKVLSIYFKLRKFSVFPKTLLEFLADFQFRNMSYSSGLKVNMNVLVHTGHKHQIRPESFFQQAAILKGPAVFHL